MPHHRLRRVRVRALGAGAVLAVTLIGCAETTIDPNVTTEPAAATTTTLPSGTPAELLPRLVIETGKLSDTIGIGEGEQEQMQTIDNLWNAVRPAVAETDGVLVLTFDATMELCRLGERLNRPADADKCFRNLSSLVESFLAQYP